MKYVRYDHRGVCSGGKGGTKERCSLTWADVTEGPTGEEHVIWIHRMKRWPGRTEAAGKRFSRSGRKDGVLVKEGTRLRSRVQGSGGEVERQV